MTDAIRSAPDVEAEVIKLIDAYARGDDVAKPRALALGRKWGFEAGKLEKRLAVARATWAERAAEVKPPLRFFDPPAKLVKPQAEVKAEAKPEAAVGEPVARFGNLRPATDDGPVMVSQLTPYDTAKEWVRRNGWQKGHLAVWFWQDDFWEWNGQHYEVLPQEMMRDRLYAWLDGCQRWTNELGRVKFSPTQRHVNEVLDALRSGLALKQEFAPPMWIDTRERADGVLVFRNGIVNVLTGERQELTPRLWVHSAAGYEWDEAAKCPVWERFLEEVFPGDRESQECVEEQLGYGMTEDVRFQKGALWIGEKRTGKSTLAWVQRRLVGDRLYVGLSFNSWMAGENSGEVLIGKRVAVFPDVRFKPGKMYGRNWDAGGIEFKSAEMLLNITGGDCVSVGRKYRARWQGVLPTKVIVISNEVPNLNDGSGVLPTRFVKVVFGQSFFGREDVDLKAKLEAELPGIAARCLGAYRRLAKRGRFVQPASATALERQVEEKSDPMVEMVRDRFVVDPKGHVECWFAETLFKKWCAEHGRHELLESVKTPSQFSARIKKIAGFENVRTMKPHGQQRRYVGMRVKTDGDRAKEIAADG